MRDESDSGEQVDASASGTRREVFPFEKTEDRRAPVRAGQAIVQHGLTSGQHLFAIGSNL